MEGSKIEIVIVEEQVDVIDVACDLSLGLVNEQTINSLSGQLFLSAFIKAFKTKSNLGKMPPFKSIVIQLTKKTVFSTHPQS